MATTTQYLEQLQKDKQTLVDNLVAKGVEASSDETFTSLVPKVADIQAGEVYTPEYISFYQYKGTRLENALKNIDTSNVTDMNSMFYYCSQLTTLDLSSFNTSNVTSMYRMFGNCSQLKSIDLSSFTTSKLASNGLSGMFYYCTQLTTLDLSSFDTTNLTDMRQLFSNCSSLQYLDIRKFNFTKVNSYSDMFYKVPVDCEIIVADDTARNWILARRSDFTNVKTVAELV